MTELPKQYPEFVRKAVHRMLSDNLAGVRCAGVAKKDTEYFYVLRIEEDGKPHHDCVVLKVYGQTVMEVHVEKLEPPGARVMWKVYEKWPMPIQIENRFMKWVPQGYPVRLITKSK